MVSISCLQKNYSIIGFEQCTVVLDFNKCGYTYVHNEQTQANAQNGKEIIREKKWSSI